MTYRSRRRMRYSKGSLRSTYTWQKRKSPFSRVLVLIALLVVTLWLGPARAPVSESDPELISFSVSTAGEEEILNIQAPELTLEPQEVHVKAGETFLVTATVINATGDRLGPGTVHLHEPAGFGVVVEGPLTLKTDVLEPGQAYTLTWTMRALRPHTVNMDRPWPFGITVSFSDEDTLTAWSAAYVKDERPGNIYYILTTDLNVSNTGSHHEYDTVPGEAPLAPETAILETASINRIADRYGAAVSHFLPSDIIAGVNMNTLRSKAVTRPAADIVHILADEAAKGHQYALRRDASCAVGPDSSEYAPVSYADVWEEVPEDERPRPNQVEEQVEPGRQTGGSDNVNVCTDMLVTTIAALGDIMRAFGQGEQLVVGSQGDTLANTGIERLPGERLDLTCKTATPANERLDDVIEGLMSNETIRPGVHAVIGSLSLRHAAEDDQILEALNEHLAYVTDAYANQNLLRFATVNEFVGAWLDYYTPRLLAVRGAEIRRPERDVYEYPIIFLGKDIPVGGRFQHEVTVNYPLYMAESIAWAGVYRDGELIARFDDVPTDNHSVSFIVDKPGDYRLLVIEFPEG